jgi:myo-inositol catabolism protein IolC
VDTIGHAEPLFLLAPPPGADRDVVGGVLARLLAEVPGTAGQLGILSDAALEPAMTGSLLAVPTGRDDDAPFELAHGDGFGRHLEEAGADLAHVGLSWNPGNDPTAKKAMAMAMSRLAAWVHETDRELVVDLEVPATPDDLEQVEGDRDRFRAERHPELVVRAVQEIRDLGIEPDLWIVEPPASEDAFRELTATVGEAGRGQVGVLLADDASEPVLRAATEVPGYRGLVLGRSLWTAPLAALVAGEVSRDATVAEVAAAAGRRIRMGSPNRRR